jgi:hypothetical protein
VATLRNLAGQTFNRLTVLERAPNSKDGSARWVCKCSCGNQKVVTVSGDHLVRGRVKGCGCLKIPTHNLTGHVFGRLTVLERAPNSKSGKTRWVCKCSCGGNVIVLANSLVSGKTKACGCLRSEPTHGHARKGRRSVEHRAWSAMLDRCLNPNNSEFKNYGGRGITVCNRWRFGENSKTGFECFLEDMGIRPGLKYSLEREKVNGNYCPENCYWATVEEQQNNRRDNVFVSALGGDTPRTLAQWGRLLGIPRSTVTHRTLRHVRSMARLRARMQEAAPTTMRAIGAELARHGRALIHEFEKEGNQ